MKTAIRNYTYGIALFFAIGFSTITMANDENKAKSSTTIEFKFIGNLEDRPVFQLDLNSAEGDEYEISFSDRDGFVLYSSIVKATNFSRKFMINTEEVGDNVLTVEVRSRKTKKTETYTISRNQTIVQEHVVAKVK